MGIHRFAGNYMGVPLLSVSQDWYYRGGSVVHSPEDQQCAGANCRPATGRFGKTGIPKTVDLWKTQILLN